MPHPELPLTGSCLCGAVSVRVTRPALLTVACHCLDCQKLSASAFSLTAMFPAKAVAITGQVQRGGLHTPARAHYYCARCLTFVFSQLESAPDRVNVRPLNLDDVSWFTPFVDIMLGEKQPWVQPTGKHQYTSIPQSLAELQGLMKDYAGQ